MTRAVVGASLLTLLLYYQFVPPASTMLDVENDVYEELSPDEIQRILVDLLEPEPESEPEPDACSGRWCYTVEDMLAALELVGPRTRCTLRYEVGMSWRDPRTDRILAAWDPNKYNLASGVIGPGQLCCLAYYHRDGRQLVGLLPRFMASRDDADPWSPSQVVPWVDQQIRDGLGHHWYAISAGLC